jgi:hypothetical protein
MKSEGYGLQDRIPDSGLVRQDRWNAINNNTPGLHTSEPTTNGTSTAYAPTSTTPSHSTSPTTSYGTHPGQQQFATSTATSPLMSPPPHTQGQFPPHLPTQPPGMAQQASITLQQQLQPSRIAPSPMTAEQTEAWLQSLETRFGGDDVTAFVEGIDWQDWAIGAAGLPGGPPGIGGWLSTVWTNSSNI